MSLSPLPEIVRTTISLGLNFIFRRAPNAWADSRAGMIPSIRVSSKAESKASLSLIAKTCARPIAERLACIGPIPG